MAQIEDGTWKQVDRVPVETGTFIFKDKYKDNAKTLAEEAGIKNPTEAAVKELRNHLMKEILLNFDDPFMSKVLGMPLGDSTQPKYVPKTKKKAKKAPKIVNIEAAKLCAMSKTKNIIDSLAATSSVRDKAASVISDLRNDDGEAGGVNAESLDILELRMNILKAFLHESEDDDTDIDVCRVELTKLLQQDLFFRDHEIVSFNNFTDVRLMAELRACQTETYKTITVQSQLASLSDVFKKASVIGKLFSSALNSGLKDFAGMAAACKRARAQVQKKEEARRKRAANAGGAEDGGGGGTTRRRRRLTTALNTSASDPVVIQRLGEFPESRRIPMFTPEHLADDEAMADIGCTKPYIVRKTGVDIMKQVLGDASYDKITTYLARATQDFEKMREGKSVKKAQVWPTNEFDTTEAMLENI